MTQPAYGKLFAKLYWRLFFAAPNPPEPTPADRVIEDPDGLDNYETTFPTFVEGGVIIGIAGKNNANNEVDFTVLVDDEPVQV